MSRILLGRLGGDPLERDAEALLATPARALALIAPLPSFVLAAPSAGTAVDETIIHSPARLPRRSRFPGLSHGFSFLVEPTKFA